MLPMLVSKILKVIKKILMTIYTYFKLSGFIDLNFW